MAVLTALGFTTHLQKVVLDIVVGRQMQKFEETLREELAETVRAITRATSSTSSAWSASLTNWLSAST
ncbi:hypothetical protein D16iCDA_02055 [Pseudomonas seleniipraecipitans]|uniref:Uncharacterized protein n=1 Tax=Phytopseudomonas seleniipraecipitans TaxID=640205 RepID=A0ABY5JCD5_9GAMM|nr:hypothetical protein [Pseudomonas seleniipraecipitans]UUD64512.1 hypothetical protein D16iCDA_02055 [Pseudomonas seleniipraecipitans]